MEGGWKAALNLPAFKASCPWLSICQPLRLHARPHHTTSHYITLHHTTSLRTPHGACSRWLPTAAAAPPILNSTLHCPRFMNAQVFIKSGISPTASYLPACVHPKHTREPNTDIPSALAESEMVMWVQSVDDMLV